MIRNWRGEDGQTAGEHESFAKNVIRWIAQGHTRAGACFVWVEGACIKGGIAYAAGERENATILDFFLCADSFHLGARLLTQSLARIGARNACYHLYRDSAQYDAYRQCFASAGFLVAQEKLSFRFTKAQLEEMAQPVSFRSCTQVGEAKLCELVALVTRQTLDRVDAQAAAALGPERAAKALLQDLKEIDDQPELWTLAWADDAPVGLVIPSNFGNGYGGINYIGVVPHRRGKGYVDSLLRKGTQLLLQQGVTTIIADIDVQNLPMKGALERVGYVFSQEEVVLQKTMQEA